MSLHTLTGTPGEGASGDAFGRIRTSEPYTIFDSKQLYDNLPLLWDDQEESGGGTTSVYTATEASTRIGVSLNTAGKRTRQTFMRFNYQPGKSQLALLTTVLSSAGASGITASVGLFDDNNGVFFQMDGATLKVGIRSNVTGTPVDTMVEQANVNGDPLDGTGASGITIDPTKTQILWMDLEWLGVGTVRTGFVVDGKFIVFHTFNHANSLDVVYMSTPNLPLRYQIENDGTGPATTLDHICCSVISEGGIEDNGILRYASTSGTHINANTADTIYAVYGLRLKSAYIGATIKVVEQSMIASTGDDYEWMIILNPTVATPITFSDITNSALQGGPGNAGNPSTSTVTGGTKLMGGFVKGGVTAGSISASLTNAIYLGSAIDGTVDEIYLCVRPFTSNADIDGGITWREIL